MASWRIPLPLLPDLEHAVWIWCLLCSAGQKCTATQTVVHPALSEYVGIQYDVMYNAVFNVHIGFLGIVHLGYNTGHIFPGHD
jgi:hypothetical protein